jgi:hypothetical protein
MKHAPTACITVTVMSAVAVWNLPAAVTGGGRFVPAKYLSSGHQGAETALPSVRSTLKADTIENRGHVR